MHDASEYALNDVSSPLKRSGYFEDYRTIEKNLQAMICRKFGLSEGEPLEVKVADMIMLATEARDLLPGGPHPEFRLEYVPLPTVIIPLSPADAERQFLARYRELTEV